MKNITDSRKKNAKCVLPVGWKSENIALLELKAESVNCKDKKKSEYSDSKIGGCGNSKAPVYKYGYR